MNDRRPCGFTLIEVIVALVCVSILAVMIVTFGGNVTRSANPVLSLSRASDLQSGIDNVTRAYHNLALPIKHSTLDTFKSNLQNDPATYVGVTGITVDTSRTKFIKFDGSNVEYDNSSADSFLKVTLQNSDGQSVSTIFTTR
jgi:prepilin-type N-terminal cleavage/methylation domain-containing protein